MESNPLYTFTIKHSPLVFGALLIFSGVHGYLYEESMEINGEMTSLSILGLASFVSIGTLFIYLWTICLKTVWTVRLGEQKVTVLRKNTEESIPWNEIRKIHRIRFIAPPLYRIILKNEQRSIVFAVNPFYLDFGFGIIDLSSMGKLVKKKKRQFRI